MIPARYILLALPFSLPMGAASQAMTAPSAVVPGIALTVGEVRGSDTVVFRRSITKSGIDSVSGTRTIVRRVTALNGVRALEVVQRFPGRGGEIVDTALAEFSTLRATAHRSHQPRRIMRFEFIGDTAQGSVTELGSAGDSAPSVKAVRQPVGGPIFDSNILEFVIAGLPLAPGFNAELPFFIYERGGRVVMPVKVVDRATLPFPIVGKRDAWVVTLGVPGAPATIWVDASTRSVLRVRYDIAASAMSFTDDRATALPTG